MPKVEKRVVIGFETTQEFKDRAIKAANSHEVDGVEYPLTLSAFCRIAAELLIRKIEGED